MILLRITLFTEYPSVLTKKRPSTKLDETGKTKKEQLGNVVIKKKDENIPVSQNLSSYISLESWEKFINKKNLQGLILDLSQNSILQRNESTSTLTIDISKKNTYPKKCVDDFIKLIIENYDISSDKITTEYQDQLTTLYKKSVSDKIKSKEDMYDSIKDNKLVKEIENVFDAKIDKDNISKL